MTYTELRRAGVPIPPFDPATGYLPPGIHDATLVEVENTLGFTLRRLELLNGLRRVLDQLFAAGVNEVVLAGSFCTSAPAPNDIDGYWVFQPGLNLAAVDQDILFMDRVAMDPRTGLATRVVKLKYGVELFMDNPRLPLKINGKSIRDFFTHSREGTPRGCVRILRNQQ